MEGNLTELNGIKENGQCKISFSWMKKRAR